MQHHHAYILFANSLEESLLPIAYKVPSMDVFHVNTQRLSIDEVRSLTTLSLQRPFEGDTRVFIIVTKDIAIEAQNALLKLFEEPPLHARFFLVLPSTAFLLPTLRSRVAVFENDSDSDSDSEGVVVSDADKNDVFASFLSMNHAERMLAISDHTKEKDPVWIEAILRGCERWAHMHAQTHTSMLTGILMVRQYIDSKGASAKMLLEELALLLPYKE